MHNPNKPKPIMTIKPAPTDATMPFLTTAGPLWIGIEVINRTERDDRLCAANGGWRLIWLRDIDQAEKICSYGPTSEPLCVIFEKAGVRVSIDYANESFKDFIESCADELIHNEPTWNDPAEETLTKDAIRFLSKLI